MGGFIVWQALVANGAQAAVPVVFEGFDASEALSRVSERTGLPETQLVALPLEQLRQTPPEARGDAVLRRCATTPVAAEPIRTDFARAKAAFVKGDRFKAMDYLDLAVAKIGCLSEVVDRKVASLVFVFRGALMVTSNDDAAIKTGRGELRTSVELVRERTFPDWLPPEAQPVFDEVLAEVEAADNAPLATLKVMPRTTVSGPWVNGSEVATSVDLRPGLHLLQYSTAKGIRSGWLSIGGPAEVVLPGQIRGPVLDKMREETGRVVVAAMIEVAVDELSAAYVTHDGGLWLLSKEGDRIETTVVEPPAEGPAEEPVTEEPKKRRKKGKKRR
ncbi:MAG: hypothetical protein AAGA48_35095 [Myxococcota bacterium]